MLTAEGCRGRQQRLRQALAAQKLDAAVISDPIEIYYFTGVIQPVLPHALRWFLWIDAQRTFLVAPLNSGEAYVDEVVHYQVNIGGTANPDWLRRINSFVQKRLSGMSARRIGYQAEALQQLIANTVSATVHPDEWVAIDDLISNMQRRKDPDELAVIKRSIEIDLAAYRAAQAAIAPGVSEVDVLTTAQRAASLEAGENVWHNGDYAAGAAGGYARDRKIKAGELYIIDAWTHYHGYWSDLSRAYIVGSRISKLQQSIFDHLKAIHEEVPSLLKPGIDGSAVWRRVDALVREHPALAEHGLTHHAGHGIGLRAHELPDLNPTRGGILEVGQVITCEPGGYPEAARGGVRLENMYLITENGAQNLSVFPMSLR